MFQGILSRSISRPNIKAELKSMEFFFAAVCIKSQKIIYLFFHWIQCFYKSTRIIANNNWIEKGACGVPTNGAGCSCTDHRRRLPDEDLVDQIIIRLAKRRIELGPDLRMNVIKRETWRDNLLEDEIEFTLSISLNVWDIYVARLFYGLIDEVEFFGILWNIEIIMMCWLFSLAFIVFTSHIWYICMKFIGFWTIFFSEIDWTAWPIYTLFTSLVQPRCEHLAC